MVPRINLTNYFFVFCLCVIISNVQAQVNIIEEPAVKRVMSKYKSVHTNAPVVRGWRIQILTTNDRSEMEAGILKFERLYSHIDYKWEHNPPYYQVRIGAYEKKEDLEAFLLEMKKDFPSSIPVQDDIEKREILKY